MSTDDNGKLRGSYQGYTLTDSAGKPTDAAALFLAKFGHEPERVVKAGCILLAGPIDGNGRGPRQDAPEPGGGQVGAGRQLALEFEEVTR